MSKKLVIIEGAGKVAKIKSYLGMGYEVLATGGHFRKLSGQGKYRVGIDNDYNPIFAFSKSNNWKRIQKSVKENDYDTIYIASDPDREGEAIGWHVYDCLDKYNQKKTRRITFNEISKNAIQKALNNPMELDLNLVHAQFGRSIYDKMFGYLGSNYVRHNLQLNSIGRVQGVAVKFIGDRLKEIDEYKPIYHQQIKPTIIDDNNTKVTLTHFNKENNQPITYPLDQIPPNIKNPFINESQTKSEIKHESPPKPYITSKLLSDANTHLKINAKKTQAILQELYQKGLITYPRTDSYALSDAFFNDLVQFLRKDNRYASITRVTKGFHKDNKNAQSGHECLRVVDINKTPTNNEVQSLGNDFVKVYNLIYNNSLLQGLEDTSYYDVVYEFVANDSENKKHYFKTTNKIYTHRGFKTYVIDNEVLYDFSLNHSYVGEIKIDDKKLMNPKPSYFNESSLIKELENKGIGRPSTYATYPSIIQEKQYAFIKENKFFLTESGKILYDVIENHFKDYVNYDFTRQMEEDLDLIAENKLDYKTFIKNHDQKLSVLLKSSSNTNQNSFKPTFQKNTEFVDENKICNHCNKPRIKITTPSNKTYWKCETSKYDPKTKKWSGCEIEWDNSNQLSFNQNQSWKEDIKNAVKSNKWTKN